MRLRQAMMSSALQQSATLLLYFATGVVIAHLLTPREAGSYSVALASVNAVSALKEQAVASYVVSAPELDNALLRAAFGLSLAIGACLAVGFFGLSFLLADFYRDPAVGQSLRILALAQLAPAMAFPATVRLMRAMRFGSLLAIGLAAAAFQSLTSITLAALGCEAVALAWGYLASASLLAALTMACQRDALGLRPTLAGTRRILGFGSWISATFLVGSIATSTPELMIGRALGLANAALFSRAQNLVSFVRNGLFVGMTRPLLPSLGEREGQGASLAPIYLRLVETITGLAWPAYAVLAVWADPLVRSIYGEAWSAAGAMMTPIAIAHGLTLAVAPHYDILIVKRRPQLLLACELSVFVITVMALGFGLTLGIREAVWSLVVSSAFFAACYFVALRNVVGFAPSALFKAWSRSLMLAAVAMPAPLAFRYLAGDTRVEILLGFAASGVIAATIWSATVTLIRHELSLHISQLLGSAFVALTSRRFSGLAAAARRSR